MTDTQILDHLKKAGTEQGRKTYARHGVPIERTWGVSYAVLDKLAREIGPDQAMAEKLWASGVHDAQVLACKVCDPAVATPATLKQWAGQADSYVLADAVAAAATRSPHAEKLARTWIDATSELLSAVGWSIHSAGAAASLSPTVAKRVHPSIAAVDDETYARLLQRIETDIHSAPNRTRYSMNGAMIAIGLSRPALRDAVLATARRIGKVEVDHGDTDCKTPDCVTYIQKNLGRLKKAPPGTKATSR